MISANVSPSDPTEQQPTIGLIGMGAMGSMYAKHLSDAGWNKYLRGSITPSKTDKSI